MSTIERTIELNVPVSDAYNQWTLFEEFPRFMEGVEQVTQIDDGLMHWKANIAGKDEEWYAEITEQIPDSRIAWRSRDGAENAGVVTFQRLSDEKTRIRLQLTYEPHGLLERVGDALSFVTSRVEGDLERFKEFIESRRKATAGWRGVL